MILGVHPNILCRIPRTRFNIKKKPVKNFNCKSLTGLLVIFRSEFNYSFLSAFFAFLVSFLGIRFLTQSFK